jgi:type IV fimbrial biogenesis protein FimT
MKTIFLRKVKLFKRNDLYVGLAGSLRPKYSSQHKQVTGFSLLEMMIYLAIMALLSGIGIHLFNQQIAEMQLRTIAHAFIHDAQLSRQYSRSQSTHISMRPIKKNDWLDGWQIIELSDAPTHPPKVLKTYSLKSQGLIEHITIPNHLLKTSQQFTDMSAPQKLRHLTFKNGQVALLNNGGFVANRMIWQHKRYPALIRHIILGPGGRWRVCDPREDNHHCSSN